MTEQQMKSISVDDLFSSGKISRKTYNTLVRARMRTVFDLKRYESGLPRLFRSGANGIREIKHLLQELDASESMPEMTSMLFAMDEPEPSKGETLLSSLTDEELALLDVVYKRQVASLLESHERLATKIAHALSPLSVTTFIRDFLYEDDDRILMLNDVNENSMSFVASVKEAVKSAVESLHTSEVPPAFRILCYQAEGLLDGDDFLLEYFKEHQRLPVLYVIQKAIVNSKDTPMVKTFLQRYDIFGGQVEIDQEKVKKSSFTITTYSNIVFDALFAPGAPVEVFGDFLVKFLGNDVNLGYLVDMVKGDFVTESADVVAEIIHDEHLMMQPICVVAVLGKLLVRTMACFGGYSKSFGVAKDEKWQHAFLVERSMANAFDFQKELWRFRDFVVKTSTDEYVLDFNEYVSGVVEDNEKAKASLPQIADCLKEMVVEELGIALDEEGKVIVPRKRDKPLADRLYDILEKEKQPMMLDHLTECINSGDGRRYVRASVSLALNRDPRFQGSGKKGCYALREWQLPFFGSNADIVYQVLKESDKPMKGEEIVEILAAHSYNSQFSKNDLSSVVSLGKNLFRKLGGGYYGLVDREYSGDFVFPTKRTFESELEAFGAFIEQHRRPLTLNGDEEEVRLRAWFMRKRNEWEGNNTWSDEKRQAFAALVARYEEIVKESQPQPLPITPDIPGIPGSPGSPGSPDIPDSPDNPGIPSFSDSPSSPGIPSDWLAMLERVRDFITQNAREPLAMFTVEVQLANWLAAQKRAMHEEGISPEQTAALLQLRDLLW